VNMNIKMENSLQVTRISLRQFWTNKDHFLRLALIPAILLLVISIPLSDIISAIFAAQEQERQNLVLQHAPALMGYSLFYILVLAFFATNWLRFIAFDTKHNVKNSTGFLGMHIRVAHFRFALAMMLLVVFQSTIFNLLFVTLGRIFPLLVTFFLGLLIGLYFILRLSPYIVGLALDRPLKIRQAWQISKRHTRGLMASVLLVQFLLFLAEQGMALLFFAVGLLNLAPHGIYFVLSLIELARLAITLNNVFFYYRRMTELELVV